MGDPSPPRHSRRRSRADRRDRRPERDDRRQFGALEQVVADALAPPSIVRQRCSALRVLCLQEDVAAGMSRCSKRDARARNWRSALSSDRRRPGHRCDAHAALGAHIARIALPGCGWWRCRCRPRARAARSWRHARHLGGIEGLRASHPRGVRPGAACRALALGRALRARRRDQRTRYASRTASTRASTNDGGDPRPCARGQRLRQPQHVGAVVACSVGGHGFRHRPEGRRPLYLRRLVRGALREVPSADGVARPTGETTRWSSASRRRRVHRDRRTRAAAQARAALALATPRCFRAAMRRSVFARASGMQRVSCWPIDRFASVGACCSMSRRRGATHRRSWPRRRARCPISSGRDGTYDATGSSSSERDDQHGAPAQRPCVAVRRWPIACRLLHAATIRARLPWPECLPR